MKNRDIFQALARALPSTSMTRRIGRAAPTGLFGLARVRRSRPRSPLGWLTAGALLAGAAWLLSPSRRRSLQTLVERTGGGVGKQLGAVVGAQVGAHPLETTKLVRGARDWLRSDAR